MIETLRKITEETHRVKLEAANAALRANDKDRDTHESSIRYLDQEVKEASKGGGCAATAIGCVCGYLISLIVVMVAATIITDPSDNDKGLASFVAFVLFIVLATTIGRSFFKRRIKKRKQPLLEKIAEHQEEMAKSQRQRPALEQAVSSATEELDEFLRLSNAWRTKGGVVKTEPTEEFGALSVILMDAGAYKISTIKAVREVTGLGLKEATDLVNSTPKTLKENLPKESVRAICKRFNGIASVKVE